jgi:hypothetical protein
VRTIIKAIDKRARELETRYEFAGLLLYKTTLGVPEVMTAEDLTREWWWK